MAVSLFIIHNVPFWLICQQICLLLANIYSWFCRCSIWLRHPWLPMTRAHRQIAPLLRFKSGGKFSASETLSYWVLHFFVSLGSRQNSSLQSFFQRDMVCEVGPRIPILFYFARCAISSFMVIWLRLHFKIIDIVQCLLINLVFMFISNRVRSSHKLGLLRA